MNRKPSERALHTIRQLADAEGYDTDAIEARIAEIETEEEATGVINALNGYGGLEG